jgi:protein-tyrosine kinase
VENIRQAVERAKARSSPRQSTAPGTLSPQRIGTVRKQEVVLDPDHLQSRRIVAFDGQDPRSRSFDILRTEVLRSMDLQHWRTLAVTSPTPGCGKTVVSTNLALSIARQPDRQVCLVDLDLQSPQIASTLGLQDHSGVLDVVQKGVDLADAMTMVQIESSRLEVLPTVPTSDSADLVASVAMRGFLQDLTGYGQSRFLVIDLPPLLTSHDVISILPQVDCVLFVVGVGVSQVSDIEECDKYLATTNVVRIVLNKVPESDTIPSYNYGDRYR